MKKETATKLKDYLKETASESAAKKLAKHFGLKLRLNSSGLYSVRLEDSQIEEKKNIQPIDWQPEALKLGFKHKSTGEYTNEWHHKDGSYIGGCIECPAPPDVPPVDRFEDGRPVAEVMPLGPMM